MYYLFRLASGIIRYLPDWLIRLLADVIGPLAWLFAVRARRQATNNALHVLGADVQHTPAGRRRLRRVVRGMFRSSVLNYLEAFTLPRIDPQAVINRIDTEGLAFLDEALALGKGVILISAHFGPFEYMAQWFAAKGYPLVIPVEKLQDERMLRLMVQLRGSHGVQFLPLEGTNAVRSLFLALRKNQLILIPADRAVQGESIVRDFFGAPARLPIGPVSLSMRTGAPLVGAFGWRTSRTRITGRAIPLSLTLPEEERRQEEALTHILIKTLEEVIGQHPDQWVVFSPVWEQQHSTAHA
jgi:KDO2-lipid IV(A) lauroyltransferase